MRRKLPLSAKGIERAPKASRESNNTIQQPIKIKEIMPGLKLQNDRMKCFRNQATASLADVPFSHLLRRGYSGCCSTMSTCKQRCYEGAPTR